MLYFNSKKYKADILDSYVYDCMHGIFSISVNNFINLALKVFITKTSV